MDRLEKIIENSCIVIGLFWKLVAAIILPPVRTFITIMDEGNISRRFALYASVILTIYACIWCIEFASTTDKDSAWVAAIIAAVMTPLSGMTGALLKFYVNSKKAFQKDNDKDKENYQ